MRGVVFIVLICIINCHRGFLLDKGQEVEYLHSKSWLTDVTIELNSMLFELYASLRVLPSYFI